MSWKVHPLLQERVGKTLALIGTVGATCCAVAFSFEHVGYGLLSLCILVGSLASYFFPSHYTLDDAGISRALLGRRSTRSWSEFRRVDMRDNGLFLSTFARPSRLDSFRGVFLPFHKNRDQVVYYVQRYVDI